MANRALTLARRGEGIIRRDPWTEVQEMRRSMDEIFSRYFGYTPIDRLMGASAPTSTWTPNVELYETADNLVFSVDLPGFTQDEIQLAVSADTLQVAAQWNEKQPSVTSEPARQSESTGDEGQSSTENCESLPAETLKTGMARHYHIAGRQQQNLSLAYTLPVEIDSGRVEAQFQNGVLTVTLPKAEQVKPRQVKVQIK